MLTGLQGSWAKFQVGRSQLKILSAVVDEIMELGRMVLREKQSCFIYSPLALVLRLLQHIF